MEDPNKSTNKLKEANFFWKWVIFECSLLDSDEGILDNVRSDLPHECQGKSELGSSEHPMFCLSQFVINLKPTTKTNQFREAACGC